MTIAERINLHKCGYSRTEIDALAAAEKEVNASEAETPLEETPQEVQVPPDRSADILAAINNLTAALQRQNVNTQQQPTPQPISMTDIINTL